MVNLKENKIFVGIKVLEKFDFLFVGFEFFVCIIFGDNCLFFIL